MEDVEAMSADCREQTAVSGGDAGVLVMEQAKRLREKILQLVVAYHDEAFSSDQK